MSIGYIQGKHGRYPVEVSNGDVYFRDSSGRTRATGFRPSSVRSGYYTGPDGSSFDERGALADIQRRYDAGKY